MRAPATLDRAAIAARIPHQGTMCLLGSVCAWDAGRIVCAASSHRAADNPLRAADRLGAGCGIEYAAQAMAIHGALLAEGQPRPAAGYLTSARGVALHVERLDDIAGDLAIVAERLSGDTHSVMYSFVISSAGRALLEGRITAMLAVATSGDSPEKLQASPAA